MFRTEGFDLAHNFSMFTASSKKRATLGGVARGYSFSAIGLISIRRQYLPYRESSKQRVNGDLC